MEDLSKYQPLIRSIVFKTLGNGVTAEEIRDITQDVFVALLSGKLDKYDPNRGMELSTYIGMVTKTTAIDCARRYARQIPRHAAEAKEDTSNRDSDKDQHAAFEAVVDTAPDALTTMLQAEREHVARKVLSKLSNEDVEFLHAMTSGLDIVKYAQQIGSTPNAVYVRKHRLVHKIRKMIGKIKS